MSSAVPKAAVSRCKNGTPFDHVVRCAIIDTHKADISQMEFGGMIFAVQSQIAGGTGFLAAGYGRRQGRDDRVETTIWLVHSVAAGCPAADV